MLSSRGQSGLDAKILALASAASSKLWPRPRDFGLGLASISLSYYVIGHFSCKNRVKFGNFVNFSGDNSKSYIVNHYSVLFLIIIFGLGLGLEVLASFNITANQKWAYSRASNETRAAWLTSKLRCVCVMCMCVRSSSSKLFRRRPNQAYTSAIGVYGLSTYRRC